MSVLPWRQYGHVIPGDEIIRYTRGYTPRDMVRRWSVDVKVPVLLVKCMLTKPHVLCSREEMPKFATVPKPPTDPTNLLVINFAESQNGGSAARPTNSAFRLPPPVGIPVFHAVVVLHHLRDGGGGGSISKKGPFSKCCTVSLGTSVLINHLFSLISLSPCMQACMPFPSYY